MGRIPGYEPLRSGTRMMAWTVALLVSATVAYGQMELAVIQGSVVDEETGKPLQDVTVKLTDLERGGDTVLKTDKNGRFYRRGLRAVQHEIVVEKEGYQAIQDKLDLKAGVEGRFNFKLAKAAPQGAEDFAKGIEAFNRGDTQAAIAAFEAAAAKAPDAAEVHVNLALAYLRAKRVDDAITRLEKAKTLAGDRPQVLFQLGGAYLEAQQNEKAIAAFEQGLEKQPNLADPLAWEATVTLGALYFATGQNDKAIASFEAAAAAQPDAPAPKLGLGKAAFSTGDTETALKHFRSVVASSPGSPEAQEAQTFITEIEKLKTPA